VVEVEEFVTRVFAGGKVTVPRQLRERFNLNDGDYVRLALVEVLKKDASGEWSKKKVN
jgi:bifunctional DNA-binding transcriptional regulator/antitoxin component of YhaV-PrlF toxin-antitoxin module